MPTFSSLLLEATKQLKKNSIENPRHEAELLLSLVTKKPREFILAHGEAEISDIEKETFESFVLRRANQEPFSHISGKKEFMGLSFIITPDTLVPRPETEMMVEHAIQTVKETYEKEILIADVGTGSGCIAISTAVFLKNQNLLSVATSIAALDVSTSALEICKQNIGKHSLREMVSALHGDLLEPITKSGLLKDKKLFIVLANLPYLSEEIYQNSPETVREFEPKTALFSEEKGLSHYRQLLEQTAQIKKENSSLKIIVFFEISPEQKELFPALVSEVLDGEKVELKYFQDLAKKWRLIRLEIL